MKINITPSMSMYERFKDTPYKIYKALAEYIDNSTQSYFDNKEKLKKIFNYKLRINIRYDKEKIIIEDNAYGMDEKKLISGMKIGRKIKSNLSRNEFGVGLKSASCWFSDYWTIETSQLNNQFQHNLIFDLNEIIKNDTNEIETEDASIDSSEHFTKITLRKLSRKITSSSIKKLEKILSSIYRNDIVNNEIEIFINDKKLIYKNPRIWNDNENNEFKKIIKTSVNFEGRKIELWGFCAIAHTGTTSDYELGFDFFKNGRVIKPNYKPEKLSKKKNSYEYQRLFGEINITNIGLIQNKSDFKWEDGLEDAVLKKLADEINFIQRKASSLRKRTPISKKDFKEQTNLAKELLESSFKINLEKIDSNVIEEKNNYIKYNDLKLIFKNTLPYRNKIYQILVWLDDDKTKNFVYKNITNGEIKNSKIIKITINKNHPFLTPLLEEADQIINICKIIISGIIADICVEEFRIHENKILEYKRIWTQHFNAILSQWKAQEN